MKNVVIADDHSVVRHGLKRILSQSSDFSIVGEAASVSELRAVLLSQQEVHALVLDLSMPGGGGLEALGDIKSHYPTIAVLILSMH
ncbi:MAG: response regulator, partial [Parachlamydiaceae bacterium]